MVDIVFVKISNFYIFVNFKCITTMKLNFFFCIQAVVNQIENTVENVQVVKRKKLICENKVIIATYRNATLLNIKIQYFLHLLLLNYRLLFLRLCITLQRHFGQNSPCCFYEDFKKLFLKKSSSTFLICGFCICLHLTLRLYLLIIFQVKKLKILHHRKYKFKAEIGKLEENTNASNISFDTTITEDRVRINFMYSEFKHWRQFSILSKKSEA